MQMVKLPGVINCLVGIVSLAMFFPFDAIAQDADTNRHDTPTQIRSPELLDPVRLEADGTVIDIGEMSKNYAHAGPSLGDIDGDGDNDLLVGDFPGYFWHFENVGSNAEPKYESRGKFEAGGEAAKTPVY